MKVIDVATVTQPLSDLISNLEDDVVVLTENQEPVAFLVPSRNVDREDIALSLSPEFMTIINQARAEFKAGKKLSLEEMKRAVLDAA